ncbi:MAG: hypothetical protein WDO19_06405 [Bacteroidota bacterium]
MGLWLDSHDYKYSSAIYYELREKNFSFLKNLREKFKVMVSGTGNRA